MDHSVLVFVLMDTSGYEDPAQSVGLLRFLTNQQRETEILIGALMPDVIGDRVSDRMFQDLERFRIAGHTKVIFLTDLPEAEWQNLRLELLDAHRELEFTRVIPEQSPLGMGYVVW